MRKIKQTIIADHTIVDIEFRESPKQCFFSIKTICVLGGEQFPGIGYTGHNLSQAGMIDLAKYAELGIGVDIMPAVTEIINEINNKGDRRGTYTGASLQS